MNPTVIEQKHVGLWETGPEHSRRVALLPRWIRFFSWIFLLFGVLGLFGFVGPLISEKLSVVDIYGVRVNGRTSLLPYLLLCGLVVFNGVTAHALLFGRRNGVDYALVCAVIGTTMLFVSSVVPVDSGVIRLPGELIFLLPFAYKMVRIRGEWNREGA